MSKIKLISVDILNNYVEHGDDLYVTVKWQNCGEQPLFDAEIAMDLVFCGRHRRDENQSDSFRCTWKPFPSTALWKKGDIITTTGKWSVPRTWGGSFDLTLSLIDENGANIDFIGKDSALKFSQSVTEIEIGWGWGRQQLLKQRHSLHIDINNIETFELDSNNDKKFLKNDFIFNENYPSVCGYKTDFPSDFDAITTVRNIKENKLIKLISEKVINYKSTQTKDGITYSATCDYCSFDVVFTFYDNCFDIKIDNVVEKENYELISLEMPSLIQIAGEDAKFTNFYGGGRLCELSNTLCQSVNFKYDICNAVSAFNSEISFCVVTDNLDALIKQSVFEINNRKAICLGATILNKVAANKENLKSISADDLPIKVYTSKGGDWQLSARVLNCELKEEYAHTYENAIMYKIDLDMSGQYDSENPITHPCLKVLSLKDAKEAIMKIHNLSNGIKQIVYLVGWQTGGHDFAYPNPHLLPFNEKCGTMQEFLELREELKAYNVCLSFHDNFDDAYVSSPQYNEDLFSIDNTGNHWKGWLWSGGMSYILCPKLYADSEEMKQRINKILSDYHIEESYHLDVLSSEVLRYSFDSQSSLNSRENLEGKYKIIEEFNKYGVDITSETLSMPFVGKVGYFQNTRYNFNTSLFFGDELLPLTTIAFHGTAPYKVGGGDILKIIGLGSSCNSGFDVSELSIAKNLYLLTIPMTKLAYKKILNFDIKNNVWDIIYEDNCKIKVDFENNEYSIIYNGVEISKNYKTFMFLDNETYCYFSSNKGRIDNSLPKEWASANVYKQTAENRSFVATLDREEFENYKFEADTVYFIKSSIQ